jgi:tetratricopeptide (TPR) repeat protein
MVRWLLALILIGPASVFAQGSQPPQQTPPVSTPNGTPNNPGELQKQRPQQKTSDKDAVPPEEDTSIGATTYSFNPLQAKKDVEIGNEYAKKHSYRAAANRFLSATKYNDGDAEAWLRLGEMDEKLRDKPGAHEAYSKYLELAADAKNAAEIKKRMDKLK